MTDLDLDGLTMSRGCRASSQTEACDMCPDGPI